jgi:hypothetical protein
MILVHDAIHAADVGAGIAGIAGIVVGAAILFGLLLLRQTRHF